MSTANEVWGRTATELITRNVEPWDFEKARYWASETAVYMLSEAESHKTIARRIKQTVHACSDENAKARFTNAFIEQLIDRRLREMIELKQMFPQVEAEKTWLADGDEFMRRDIEAREPLLVDAETGSAVLYEKSLNQIFAYRGIGKSVVANALIKVLTQGGEFLRFKSDGGLKTVLVDGELPAVQLQERLKEFSGTPKGLLKILSPELMPNPKAFPVLSNPDHQDAFLDQIEDFAPHVIIFDTLTRCFKFDTNDPDAWLVVNDFLLELRFRGYCVVLIHHAGKNGTQRGRTDGDDNLDISVILSPRYGWQPGDGLEFKWTYEKVRHGGHLPDFEAEYHGAGRWQIVQDDRTADVIALAKKGKTQRAIGLALEMGLGTVNRILKQARQRGLIDLNEAVEQRKG